MKIIAHRGAAGTYRENSRESFAAAYEMGAFALETDIRRCSECWKLKLSHDPIRSEEECSGLADFTDVLDFGESMELVLEIKETGIIREVIAITEQLRFRDKIIYSSFLWGELWKISLSGRAKRLGLLWDSAEKKIPRSLVGFIAKLMGAKSIHLDFTMILNDRSLVIYFRERGFEVFAYTVNSVWEIETACSLNLGGIFTDYPAYASYLIFDKTGD